MDSGSQFNSSFLHRHLVSILAFEMEGGILNMKIVWRQRAI